MDKAAMKRLKAAGYQSGSAADFLGLTEEERKLAARQAREAVSKKRKPQVRKKP